MLAAHKGEDDMATISVKRDGDTFLVRYLRRRRKTNIVVACQAGFATAEEAQAWGEQAQKIDLEERRHRRLADPGHQDAVKRKRQQREQERQQTDCENALRRLPLRELVSVSPNYGIFKERVETLWQEVAWRALKRGEKEHRAYQIADSTVGANWRERREKALSGMLDEVVDFVDTEAVANAKLMLHLALERGLQDLARR